ncbi:MAG: hypothetical protein QNJ36_16420 [Calothrix sp. MO_167.B42]|nr:hypothetical protein [Calothrix sp. MO_167.B42]
MTNRNSLIQHLWHKMQEDSVSWGSLMLWITALVALLLMVTMFPVV